MVVKWLFPGLAVMSVSLFVSHLNAQSLFLESSEQALMLEFLGKWINPGVYYERAFLTNFVENFSLSAGAASFFMRPDDSPVDLSFPTWAAGFIKYKAVGDARWTYLEFGLSIYHKNAGPAVFPAWAAGYCFAPKDNNPFIKRGLTSVQLLPFIQVQAGWRF